MLIRLVSYGKNNTEHIDQMIAIDGLPDEWIFDRRKLVDSEGKTEERLFLKSPWEPDITENIPMDIRGKFASVPYEVWFETPQEIRPGTYQSVELAWIRWVQTVYGVRLNMQTNQGEALWRQIEDLLDRETPRNQRIPQPAIVGTKIMWTLSAEKVPHVRLTGSVLEVPKTQIVEKEKKPEPRPDQYPCRTCGDVFDKERGRWMHERRKHASKEAFATSGKVAVAS